PPRRDTHADRDQETRTAASRIRRLTNNDDLSALAYRRGFEAELAEAFEAAAQTGQPLTLLAIDLDHFKQLNDTLGHAKGDEAIRAAGEVLSANLRAGDVAGRLGGDEFLVLLRNTCSASARHIA